MIIEDNDALRFYLHRVFEVDYQVIDMPEGDSALAIWNSTWLTLLSVM